jgi:hypothetical protein
MRRNSRLRVPAGYQCADEIEILWAAPDLKPAAYPNGRILTDDFFSMRFGWLTHGKVPPTGLKPHDDLQAQFPYLGPPNP